MIRLYNFLSGRVEAFNPSNSQISFYTCGPTVYDFAHIGNLRTYIFEDILRRLFEVEGFKVKHVMNITDIDDKIIKAAKEQKVDFKVITSKFEKVFLRDLKRLNILKATVYPKATANISEMIELISKLLELGFAYKADDGVYFNISKFPTYGKLSKVRLLANAGKSRIAADLYDKENLSDFALWKFEKRGEPSWPAPFGNGRPGWHIECSTMALKYLDRVFVNGNFYPERSQGIDIHAGAVDLLFPHHENEIAQVEAVTGKQFVRFWVEGEHLLVNGQKMSKTLGNYLVLDDLLKKHFNPLSFRYLVLNSHYRSKLNFTWEALQAAQNALNNLYEQVYIGPEPRISCAQFEDDFLKALEDDLNTPKALAIVWSLVKSNYPQAAKKQTLLVMDRVLGLGFDKVVRFKPPPRVMALVKRREDARKKGDWRTADKIREEIKRLGFEINDTPKGPELRFKSEN